MLSTHTSPINTYQKWYPRNINKCLYYIRIPYNVILRKGLFIVKKKMFDAHTIHQTSIEFMTHFYVFLLFFVVGIKTARTMKIIQKRSTKIGKCQRETCKKIIFDHQTVSLLYIFL